MLPPVHLISILTTFPTIGLHYSTPLPPNLSQVSIPTGHNQALRACMQKKKGRAHDDTYIFCFFVFSLTQCHVTVLVLILRLALLHCRPCTSLKWQHSTVPDMSQAPGVIAHAVSQLCLPCFFTRCALKLLLAEARQKTGCAWERILSEAYNSNLVADTAGPHRLLHARCE